MNSRMIARAVGLCAMRGFQAFWRGLAIVAGLAVLGAAATALADENLALGKRYTLSPRPNYSYCTDGGDLTQLTDGKSITGRGSFWTLPSTVGWSGITAAIITIDLGGVQPIRGVSYNTAAGAADVKWPTSISILASDDGKAYHLVGELVSLSNRQHGPPGPGHHTHRYATDQLRTHGRYLSLIAWAAGAYTFVDEVEVFKGEPAWLAATLPGVSEASPAAFLARWPVERRLVSDARSVQREASLAGVPADVLRSINEELDAVQSRAPVMPILLGPQFRAVLPLNEEHARVFRAQARLWRAQGVAPLSAWTTPLWDPLDHLQTPPRDARASLQVAMMQNEFRAAAFNVSNAADREATLRLRLSGLPGGDNPPWVTVHEVAWTDTKSGRPVAAALPEARRERDEYLITVPVGMTRQVWLTLHPVDVKPGSYEAVVHLAGETARLQVPLSLRIAALRFPDHPALHVGGWDYTHTDSFYDIGPGNRDAVLRHLREHFVDSPWATGTVLPANRDTALFDRWLTRWPGARQYCVFTGGGAQFNGAAAGSPEFDRQVGDWVKFWAAHARLRGLKPEQLVLLIEDEPNESQRSPIYILPWAKAIHAAKTGVRVFEDPTYHDPAKADQQMMAACDILCPNHVHYLTGNQAFRDYYAASKARGTALAFYSCSGPVRLLDPYSYHRLQAWTCWQIGGESSFFWAFGDSGGGSSWDEYRQAGGASFVPFFLDATSVTPGKHMEAIRESVEDYEYLLMLHDRLAALAKRGVSSPAAGRAGKLLVEAAGRVVQPHAYAGFEWHTPKDRSVADRVRVEILDALVELDRLK